jgi:hypothetical protein
MSSAAVAVHLTISGASMRQQLSIILCLSTAILSGCYSSKTDLTREDASFLKRTVGYASVNYSEVHSLSLQNKDVTDDDMGRIAKFQGLIQLDLRGTAITDAGLEKLSTCTSIETILLSRTAVTSAGVQRFVESHVPQLTAIGLEETSVDADTLKDIKARGVALCVTRTPDGHSYVLIGG